MFNGQNLNWRYPPYIRPIRVTFQGISPQNMAIKWIPMDSHWPLGIPVTTAYDTGTRWDDSVLDPSGSNRPSCSGICAMCPRKPRYHGSIGSRDSFFRSRRQLRMMSRGL